MDPPAQQTFEADGILLRRNLLPIILAALPGVLALLAFLVTMSIGATHDPWWFPFGSLAIMGSWLATPLVWSANGGARKLRGKVRVDARGIFVNDALVVPIEQIESAVFAKSGWQHPVVRIRRRHQLFPEQLRVSNDVEARHVIAALGLDAAHRSASYALPWKPFKMGALVLFYMYLWFVGPAALFLALFLSAHDHARTAPGPVELTTSGAAGALLFAAAMIGAYWSLWSRSRLHVTFGTDGISMTQWGKKRFIHWPDVSAVEPWPGAMVRGMRAASEGFDLLLQSGERISFTTSQERRRLGLFEGDVVAERLRDAMAVFSANSDVVTTLLPTREDLSAHEWISALRVVGSGANVGMRTAAVDAEQLWRVVENPEADAIDRAAAAAALTGGEDAALPVRLRAAAAATAAPKLRVAIEAAADGDDAELAEALDALSNDVS